ncbi:MAG: hypothetical protein KJS92_03320 [Bacteroidetes bacterium]|nr:hypothetical protein [Bacteroidota bacterium]
MPLAQRLKAIIRICGITLLLLGALDPLEGSVLIALGAIFLAWEAGQTKRKGKRFYYYCATGIIIGVAYLFWISSLGGFGGTASWRSWWWGLGILPYPIGWLTLMVRLLMSTLRKK